MRIIAGLSVCPLVDHAGLSVCPLVFCVFFVPVPCLSSFSAFVYLKIKACELAKRASLLML